MLPPFASTPCFNYLPPAPVFQVLQQEVRKTWRHGCRSPCLKELKAMEVIGRGGYGVVYKGLWHKSVAAIKVGNCSLGMGREGGGRRGGRWQEELRGGLQGPLARVIGCHQRRQLLFGGGGREAGGGWPKGLQEGKRSLHNVFSLAYSPTPPSSHRRFTASSTCLRPPACPKFPPPHPR